MRVKVNKDQTKDVPVAKVSNENYIVEPNERGFYHCRLEQPSFDSKSGRKLSKPFIQKFDKKFFENGGFEALKQQGYTIEILYKP